MKPQDMPDAQAIARLIENGSATRWDWAAFLIYIRDSIPEGMVRTSAISWRTRCETGFAATRTTPSRRSPSGCSPTYSVAKELKSLSVLETSALVEELCRDAPCGRRRPQHGRGAGSSGRPEAALADVLDGSSILLKHPDIGSCELNLEPIQNLDGSQEMALMCTLRAKHDLVGSALTIAAGDGRAFKIFG